MRHLKKTIRTNTNLNTATSTTNISEDINKNIEKIKNDFGNTNDLIINYFVNNDNELIYANLYIRDLVDKKIINNLSQQLAKFKCKEDNKGFNLSFDSLIEYLSNVESSSKGFDYDTLYNNLLNGNIIFLFKACNNFFYIEAASMEGRGIEEPTSQNIIRGPKNSFTEKINSNVLLIRKIIKNEALRLESMSIGNVTKTSLYIIYINNIAKPKIVQEIRDRLKKIDIDGILDSGYIEELIKDDSYSIFPTFLNSEKPDSVSAALLEGKVAILVDGTPYVLTAPAVLFDFLQVSEDYYHNYIIASITRIFRAIAFFLTLLVPATYIAVTTFHQEIIPTPLLIGIAAQREGVPFPTLVEALLMEFAFEILREAGIRMPKAIGSAISIVGALVIGQAAVDAGIISAFMVIIVAITAISSFAIPNYEMANAIRTLRFIFMLIAGVLGLYGIVMGLIILTLHLCKIKSITVPYLTPVAPKVKGTFKDTFFRFPLWKMKYRPTGIAGKNKIKTNENNPAAPKQKGEQELR